MGWWGSRLAQPLDHKAVDLVGNLLRATRAKTSLADCKEIRIAAALLPATNAIKVAVPRDPEPAGRGVPWSLRVTRAARQQGIRSPGRVPGSWQ